MARKPVDPATLPPLPLPEHLYLQPAVVDQVQAAYRDSISLDRINIQLLDITYAYISQTIHQWVTNWDVAVGETFHRALCLHLAQVVNHQYMALAQRTKGVKVYPDLPLFMGESLTIAASVDDNRLITVIANSVLSVLRVIGKHEDRAAADMVAAMAPLGVIAQEMFELAEARDGGGTGEFTWVSGKVRKALNKLAVAARRVWDMREAMGVLNPEVEVTVDEIPDELTDARGQASPNALPEIRALLSIKPLPEDTDAVRAACTDPLTATDPFLRSVGVFYRYSKFHGDPTGDMTTLWYARQLLDYMFTPEQWAGLCSSVDEICVVEHALTLAGTWRKDGVPSITRNGLRQAVILTPLAALTTKEEASSFASKVLLKAGLEELDYHVQSSLEANHDTLWNKMGLGQPYTVDRH